VNAVGILAALHARGARFALLEGDRLAVWPRAALDNELRSAIREHKAELLRVVPGTAERHCGVAEPAAPGPWRLILERNEPLPGPIHLPDGCTTITNPVRCIEATLIDLERAVAHRNAGWESAFTFLIDGYIERLRACGVVARVEPVA